MWFTNRYKMALSLARFFHKQHFWGVLLGMNMYREGRYVCIRVCRFKYAEIMQCI